jgi:hypothetical protein
MNQPRGRQLCSHLVNTNSQIGTVQDSYPVLSCGVKSHLPAFPAPAAPPNSFPFCTGTFSPSKFQQPIPREFRFSLFNFRVSPLSTAFTPNLRLCPLSTAFTQISRGVPTPSQTCHPSVLSSLPPLELFLRSFPNSRALFQSFADCIAKNRAAGWSLQFRTTHHPLLTTHFLRLIQPPAWWKPVRGYQSG